MSARIVKTPVEILDATIKLYEDNPESFHRGSLGYIEPNGKLRCCTIGGVAFSAGLLNGQVGRHRWLQYPSQTRKKESYPARIALGFIARALGAKNEQAGPNVNEYTVMQFTDKDSTTVNDVIKVLKKARRAAAKAAKANG